MTPASPGPKPRDRETRWAFGVAIAVMAVTMLPYLFGAMLIGAAPARGWFSWLGYNLDDSCVYLAWMRQAADGSFFQRNLFTTDPQLGHQFSLFFLLLGNVARFAHLPLLLVYQVARLLLGVAFLRAVWWLIRMLVAEGRARRAAFLLVCLSAGLGWLPGQWRHSGLNSPVDVWQPESITFLCLYQSPLFLVSLLLMVGVLGWLLVAERTGSWRAALAAGCCGLLLGNIHTYDVITVGAVWAGYLVVRAILRRRVDAAGLGRAVLVGALTAVSSGYMFYLVKTEAVFAKRMAVETLSPPFMLYVLGYGLLPLLAAVAAATKGGRSAIGAPRAPMLGEPGSAQPDAPGPTVQEESGRAWRGVGSVAFPVTWAVVNVAVAYLPVPYQRKMLMGAHLPIAMLAGVGLWTLLSKAPERARGIALWAAVIVLGLTNVRFMLRDAGNFQTNRGQSHIQRPYMYSGEVAALEWVREHTAAGVAIQPLPWIALSPEGRVGFVDTTVACFTPGLTGHPVNAGHWGETPDFAGTMGSWVRFLSGRRSPEERAEQLRQSGVRYVIFTQKHDDELTPETRSALEEWLAQAPRGPFRLVPEASNADADVYEVTG